MDYKRKLKEYLEREVAVIQKLDIESINTVLNVLEDARFAGKKVFICGNGGSAATASHYCCDFN